MNDAQPVLLDCTLRDGGYHNAWDFSPELIQEYLNAIAAAGIDWAEFGFRFAGAKEFLGGCAYSTDAYIQEFEIPAGLHLAVMVNGSDILTVDRTLDVVVVDRLFADAAASPLELVRIACHARDLEAALPAAQLLADKGYRVAFNLMQVADRSNGEIATLAAAASKYPVEVLYFADSLGNLTTDRVAEIVAAIRSGWSGSIGIHTHDNMSRALVNAAEAYDHGVTWLDGTITGMGRGPGNARTELLVLEFESRRRDRRHSYTQLLEVLDRHFLPMQRQYGWGTNAFYYLSGRYGVHPTFVQEMINDDRYSNEDILASLEHLHGAGAKSFRRTMMDASRQFYREVKKGTWDPQTAFAKKDVLILGSGPGVRRHRRAIELYIRRYRPIVVALNTRQDIDSELIDYHIASHPMRLAADYDKYRLLRQPTIAPRSALPEYIRLRLAESGILDYGIGAGKDRFEFHRTHAIVPSPLVFAYALAAAAAGRASRILVAGFDGYPPGDARNDEMESLLRAYRSTDGAVRLISITPTRYSVDVHSVYSLSEVIN